MKTAFLIVAVILFAIAALAPDIPADRGGGRMVPLGLAFFAAAGVTPS